MNTLVKFLLAFCLIHFVSIRLSAQAGLNLPPNDSNKVYEDGRGYENGYMLQVPPKFSGDLRRYFADSIRYPKDAVEKNIQGTVYMSFIVEKDGSVSNIKVFHTDNEILNNEAQRLISVMPKWKPGKQNGVPVRVQELVPVHFKL